MALTSGFGDGRFSRRLRAAATGIAAALIVTSTPIGAQQARPTAPTASVNVNPKRITFDRPGKSATVTVSSSGGAGAFDVELVDRVMKPNGEIVPASEAADLPELARLKSAKGLVIVTPRRVRFAQGGSQAIRLRAAATPDLAPGEYRSHLTVTGIPPADTGLTAEQAQNPTEGQLSFRINSVLAISIPVILRVGAIDVRAAIEKGAVRFETIAPAPGEPAVRTAVLTFDLVRQGSNSLFGDVEVRGSRKQGDQPIGAVRGVGVYPEIDRRSIRIVLTRLPVAGEQLDVQFVDDDTKPGTVLSKVSLMAP